MSDSITALQESYVITGTKADRPSSGGFDGQIYVATDENKQYVWDEGESSWLSIGPDKFIEAESSGLREEHADVTHSGRQTYSFDVAFSSTPYYLGGSKTEYMVVYARSISTTQIELSHKSPADGSDSSGTSSYMVIGS